ncbi:DUF4496-containing protein [Aureococcus anophagefferens]|nr:DUF4496-containing protein [Aureococcus anophagefferens]
MDEVDHIIAEILTERKHSASKTSLLLETKKLREAWDALNAWILDRVIQRRGAAVPNFGKFTWQVLGGFTPADLDPRLAGKKAASKIPLRPVFMFAENFCRSHGLPWRRQNEADLVKCGDLDYSNLALRYSSHLTKDMVFAALRDVTRRVGEKIASGFALRVKMSVGSLVCEHGKCRFEFDAASLAPRARKPQTAPPPGRQRPLARPGTPYAFTSSTFYSTPADEYEHPDTPAEYHSSVLAKTNGEIMRDSTDALLGMLPTKNHLKPSATYYRRDRDPGKPLLSELNDKCKTTGLLQAESSVADAAYERHLASIEHEANRIQDEKVVFQNLLAEGYAAREKRKNWAHLELQEYLQNQIDTKAVKHAREKEIPEDELKEQEALGAIVTRSLEASKGKTSRPADGALLRRNTSVAESLKQPMRPMLEGPFKMYNITGFPTRGRAEDIKVHELCDELARSIDFRKERVKSEREEVLEEERRFIRHVNDEMFKNKTLAKQKLDAANNELLRAWETSQHVKFAAAPGLRRDAMLSYAKSAHPEGDEPEHAATRRRSAHAPARRDHRVREGQSKPLRGLRPATARGVPASKGSSLMGLSTDSRKALIDA